jgi:hypothetical protein
MCMCVHVCLWVCGEDCVGVVDRIFWPYFFKSTFCTANYDEAYKQEYQYHTHTHIPHAHAHADTVVVLPVVVGLASEDPFGHVAQRIRVVIYSERVVR